MYSVPPTGPAWPAVGAQLERGVRHQFARQGEDLQFATDVADLGGQVRKRPAPRCPSWAATGLPAAACLVDRSCRTSAGGGPEELILKVSWPGCCCWRRSPNLRHLKLGLALWRLVRNASLILASAEEVNLWPGCGRVCLTVAA